MTGRWWTRQTRSDHQYEQQDSGQHPDIEREAGLTADLLAIAVCQPESSTAS